MRGTPTPHPLLSLIAFGILAVASPAFGQAPDHDKDGVPDLEDDCPTDPGVADNKGCPGAPRPVRSEDAELVEVTTEKVEIKRRIEFETGSAKLLETAKPIIDAVAAAIGSLGSDRRIRVLGHTDNRGSRKLNLRLSQARAEAVRDRLIKAGIDKKRLEAKGVGPDAPLADNKTSEGRAHNRRVEFQILDPAAGKGP